MTEIKRSGIRGGPLLSVGSLLTAPSVRVPRTRATTGSRLVGEIVYLRELDAVAVRDPRLRRASRRCRHAAHGRTFFLATRLLAPCQRPAIHALYGFARFADDIVDEPGMDGPAEVRLETLTHRLRTGLQRGYSDDLLEAAVIDTAKRYRFATTLFEEFLTAMRMDLTVTDYPDRAPLDEYMHGLPKSLGYRCYRCWEPSATRRRRCTDLEVRAALAAQHAATREIYCSPKLGWRCCTRCQGPVSQQRSRCTEKSSTTSRTPNSRCSRTAPTVSSARRGGRAGAVMAAAAAR